MVRIVAVRERTISIASPMANAVISFAEMTVSLVALVTDIRRDGRPVVGYGFNSNGRYGQGGLLRERFLPRLLRAASEEPESVLDESGANLDPDAVRAVLMRNEKPGGHGERSVAVGAVDMAAWDAVAKIEGRPLAGVLADRFGTGPAATRVAVYAAGGYYHPGKDHAALQAELRGYLDLGYTELKMKIGGVALADDLARVDAALAVIPGGPSALAVDANGRFDRTAALEYGRALGPYRLKWYEEAGDPLDYELQAELARAYSPPLATGENLFSMQDARNLLRHGGMRADRDVLQFDPALSYGVGEYLRTIRVAEEMGWSRRAFVPHGGHQLNLAIAAGLGLGGVESYPGVFQPFGGFADSTPIENGTVGLPDAPGIGLETKAALAPLLAELTGDLA